MKRTTIAILAIGIAGCQTSANATGWPFDQYHAAPPVKRYYKPAPKPKPKVVVRTITKTITLPSRCASPLTREGDQYATVEGAKSEADKAWMQAVRWKLGEQYMDIGNAASVSYACARSSVGSIAGQTFHRCEVTATPCRPPVN